MTTMANMNGEAPHGGGSADPSASDIDLMSAARSDTCVLLTGSADAVRAAAYRVHRLSAWRQGPFTIVDCGGPEEIVERTLFGGLDEIQELVAREPYLRLAQAGTFLLQEVWRLSPGLQSRLADRLVYLRGPRSAGRSRWRLMASSSEPLLPRVMDGRFDDHLFYRLNAIHLVVSDEGTATQDVAPGRHWIV